MNFFNHGKIWKMFLLVVILLTAIFGFTKIIKEKSLEIIIPVATSTIDFEQTASSGPTQATEILKELIAIKASSTTDWSKKIAILLDVPFASQAPLGEWSDDRQQDGCEEAAVLMAMAWVKGETLTPESAKKAILAMADWQTEKYSSFADTDAKDTADRLVKGYYNYDKVEVVEFKNTDQVIEALMSGKLVLIPTDGRKLKNPNYKQPGPSTHMLVVRGYDNGTDEFITNDSGTRKGEKYRYPTGRVFDAALDYPTGDHETIKEEKKSLIIIFK